MNILKEISLGQSGYNVGLTTGTPLDEAIGGILKRHYYLIGGSPGSGKTTMILYSFIVQPYLECLRNKVVPPLWIFNSLEMSRTEIEAKLIVIFLYLDYGIDHYDSQVKRINSDNVEEPIKRYISSNYLLGRDTCYHTNDDGTQVKCIEPLSTSIAEKVKEVYNNRIIPLMGNYDDDDNPISERRVVFCTKLTLGQFENQLLALSKVKEPVHKIVITDHIRKVMTEGKTLYETINEFSNKCVDYRNRHGITFVNLIHVNKSVSDVDRLKFAGDTIFPGDESIKGSENLLEDCDTGITLFNPLDQKYNLTTHFGVKLYDVNKRLINPYLRSFHVIKRRFGEFPAHGHMNLKGALGVYERIRK